MVHRGFTLVELLIVIALTGLLLGGAVVFAFSALPVLQLAAERQAVEDVLRRAQERTVNGDQGGVWGVHLESDRATLFQGTSYVERDLDVDEVRVFPSSVRASGLSDVVFQIRTGETAQTGTITLTVPDAGRSVSLEVNANGLVSS
ncbi:type II secretion system protein [Candidatus Uhrbacteria bacterium]|nr:type II secretion system protein [Candidatus Uhrbacteria bacterium]